MNSLKNLKSVLLWLAILLILSSCSPNTPTPEVKDPDRIIFVSDRDGNDEIYIMNVDGTEQRNLTNHPANDWFPTHSPDSKQIAFTSDREGEVPYNDRAIYVMNIDGSNQIRISEMGAGFPSWSPDGQKIAFTCKIYDSPATRVRDICVMNIDGTEKTILTNDRKFNGYPNWSPDGSKIIYGCYPDGNDDVCSMNADGSEQTRLIEDPAKDGCAEWSPDGSRILLASDRSGTLQLYLMNSDGSNLTQITEVLRTWLAAPGHLTVLKSFFHLTAMVTSRFTS